MKVVTVAATPQAEGVVCRAARGDYMTEFHGDMAFSDVMDSIQYDDEDYAWATDRFGDHPFSESMCEKTAKQRSLIRQLLRRGHFGPFEHPQITFAVEGISRVCMAQITRHRHASFDVQSLRYTAPALDEEITVESVDDYIVIPPKCRGEDAEYSLRRNAVRCFREYQALIEGGEAKEDARFVLPLGTKVNLTVSMNARMLLHVFDMRLKGDAQDEIIELSKQMLDEAKAWMPVTMEYYEEEMSPRKNQLAP